MSSPSDGSVARLFEDERGQTNQHYDRDPSFFRLFLDKTMKYSSGLFLREHDSLDDAQRQKMEFVARQMGLQGGERVLDIGCGWGALMFHLALDLGCEVVGLTPSPAQARFIATRAAELGVADRVTVETAHLQENRFPARSFDAIALLGSIVHMKDKAGVLAECHRLCRPRGRVYLSESCFRNAASEREFAERAGTRFVRDTIFGWGELIPVSNYVRFFEDASFSLVALHDLTEHYYQTIERWRQKAIDNRTELDAIAAGSASDLLHYFDICNSGWGFTTKHYAIVGARSR